MGRVAEYKDEDIVNVGLELEKKGIQVTTSAIRKSLGGGSSVRIKAIWNGFTKDRDEESALDKINTDIELPHELQLLFEKHSEKALSALKHYVTECYQASETLSEMRVKARIEEYSNQLDKFERAENEALEEIDACEHKLEELKGENVKIILKNEELAKENAGLAGQIKRLEESVARQDSINQKLENLLKENGRLQYIIDGMKAAPQKNIQKSSKGSE